MGVSHKGVSWGRAWVIVGYYNCDGEGNLAPIWYNGEEYKYGNT